ncbi:MAG: hypothetical protein EBS68_09270 [Rhodobacteraceae bacterium]|jgi:hypothetical protein|nr:hypothetical protein [Paracoccaceae bacterium]
MRVVLAFALTAGTAAAEVNGIPDAIYAHTLDRFLAEQIAGACGDYSFDRAAADADGAAVEAASGLSETELKGLAEKISTERLAADVVALFTEKKIDAGKPASFCRAGKAEIAAKSAIGTYLKAK